MNETLTNTYSPIIFDQDIAPADPTFGEAVGSTIGLRLTPIAEGLYNGFKYGARYDPNYDPVADVGPYTEHADYLISTAKNSEHMAALKSGINKATDFRATLAETTGLSGFAAGLFDPINAFVLPFGFGSSVLSNVVRTGLGAGGVELGAQAIGSEFDATITPKQAASEILMTTVFGGVLGGATTLPKVRAAKAVEATKAQMDEMFKASERIENLAGMSPDDIRNAPQRSERAYGDLDDDAIRSEIKLRNDREAEILKADGHNSDALETVRTEAQAYKNELGLRAIEESGVDLNDPYSIKSSAFTDSIFYKAVSTPMKRVLQADVPSKVKEIMVRSFADAGVTLNLNSYGIASPQSVYQRTAMSAGRWVAAHDQLIKLWSQDTGASQASRMDLNFSDISRRASRSDSTYRQWLINVNEKRLKGDTDLSETEIKASEVINAYFTEAEARLESVGFLNTPKGMQRRIELLDDEISTLTRELNLLKEKSREAVMVKGRLEELRSTRDFLRKSKNDVQADAGEPFFPRFYDFAAIRKRREEFGQILYKHFEENPYVYVYDNGLPTRKKLSTKPDDIQERVDQTIDNILGETDPASLDVVSFGTGRSKHFRSRELDIPNSLITDFIIKDPLAAMKTYAARIEPRYEYTRQFGKELDGVLFDIERELIRSNASEDTINQVLRDYRHMYDRVAGNVQDHPDALNQRAAFFLREAASFSYMGGAGLSAIPDFGRIVLEHDLEDVVKGVQGLLDKERVSMTVDEIRIAGEAIDILKGSAHMRMMEDLGNNVDANELLTSARNAFYILNGLAPLTTIAKQLDGIIQSHSIIKDSIALSAGKLDAQGIERLARYGIDADMAKEIARAPWVQSESGLYMANTETWLDSIYVPEIEGKTIKIIEANEDGSPVGKYDAQGRYYPAFYNDTDKIIRFDREHIETEMYARKGWLNPRTEGINPLPDVFDTPRQWSNFVMLHEIMHTRFRPKDVGINVKGRMNKEQKIAYENKINELAFEEFQKQKTINRETINTFRTALNSSVMNTIMHGTPADKPIITDGVAYIPMRVAKKFGMKEDPRFRGYARIENGLMGLPFQFYSFVLANVNKTAAAMAHGQVKNRAIGLTTMMGLSYLSLQMKTPDYIWDEMDWRDRLARSFDNSGILALYSDLFYTSMHTSLALGGPNITGGLISPKFKQEQSVADAITGLAGAGPSWGFDMATSIVDFAQGNYAEAGKDIVRSLPAARMWFWKDEVNQITNAWAN